MKTLHEVLILIKKYYIKSLYTSRRAGLCNIPSSVYINFQDYRIFKIYLRKVLKGQKIFYTREGVETLNPGQYMFPLEDVQSRIDWLDKHIELNKPKN